MSHQVKLSELVFSDLEMLKKAITSEGLKMTDIMHGYHQQWTKNQAHPSGQLMFGIDIGKGTSPAGIVKNKNGAYELVGDGYNVSYGGSHGLGQLSTNLNQRYRMTQVEDFVASKGWEIVAAPTTLLKTGSKEEIEYIVAPARTKSTVGLCL